MLAFPYWEEPFWSMMLRPPFMFWFQWQAYGPNVTQISSPFFILFAIFLFSCVSSEERCIQLKKNRTKTERFGDLIVQFSKFWIVNKATLIHRRSQHCLENTWWQSKTAGWLSPCWQSDLKNIKSSAVVIWGKIAARFVLRLIRLAHTDYSWTIRSLQLAVTTDNNA